MLALKLIQIGNSVACILPEEALSKLGVTNGATLYLTEAPGGGMRLSARSAEVEEEIAVGEQFMGEYQDTFRKLAG